MQRARCISALALLLFSSPLELEAIGLGQVAPDFSLQDVSGTAHSLSENAGKVVLLAFVGYG